jgi:methylthioribose-1-phosphate isomerase
MLHHCNTGALATVDWGTALGVIFAAHEQGKRIHVLVDETRPRLQGARLTAWELSSAASRSTSSPTTPPATSCARGEGEPRPRWQRPYGGQRRCGQQDRHLPRSGGAGAREQAFPSTPSCPPAPSTLNLATGDLIPIEERDMAEVLSVIDTPIAPPGITARNPAFDVTPHRYVTGIVTEAGIVYPPFDGEPAPGKGLLRRRAWRRIDRDVENRNRTRMTRIERIYADLLQFDPCKSAQSASSAFYSNVV